jgi:release factor glutamine methyltransferase
MAQNWTIRHAVSELTAAFGAAGLATPRLDARILVGHAVNLEPSLLFARTERVLTDQEFVLVQGFSARRLQHEPVSRITGHRGFWGLDFLLSPDTLDPRADTEALVTAVLEARPKIKNAAPRILDLGTGAGCILLALLNDWPAASGVGVDLNLGAVAIATDNANRLGFAPRAFFRQGRWCEGLTETFDVIVSNPPYIADAELPSLALDVTHFDPHLALSGGADGLEAYRALIPEVEQRLVPGGRLFLEIGSSQANEVWALLSAHNFRREAEHHDLGGFIRCLEAVMD